ncbi:polyprenyldihydroxybenzoate methyltransferase [Acrasis kona]|uniref:Polyprenyldihydroxybenzoate methyltransferase n=1 Tax=Acrasis kona TaxID=1008807 RepID=A0AAW2YQ47_9EUKA
MNHYNLEDDFRPFKNIKALDIGCGGGLVAESLVRLGANVTALDASYNNIEIANKHKDLALKSTPDYDRLNYLHCTAEQLAAEATNNDDLFDLVVSFEVIEHVADVPMFINSICSLTKPGGCIMLSTINRTLRSYALAIAAAEYILKIVPQGTHDWKKFLTPSEIQVFLNKKNVNVDRATGVFYNPLTENFTLVNDLNVNYMLFAIKDPKTL